MVRKEQSFGIIPFKKNRVLLVHHQGGHWAFPKGHPESSETAKETAMRELKEETNLDVDSFLDIPPFEEHYMFSWKGELIDKTVVYFAAHVVGRVKIQDAELIGYKWVTLDEAESLATFEEAKRMIRNFAKLLL